LEDIIKETSLDDIFKEDLGDASSFIKEEIEEVTGQSLAGIAEDLNIREGEEESYCSANEFENSAILEEGEEESSYSANEFEDSTIFEEVVEIGLSGEMIISEYVTEVLKVHDGNDYDDMPIE